MSSKQIYEVDEDALRDAMMDVPAMRNRRPVGAVALLGEDTTEGKSTASVPAPMPSLPTTKEPPTAPILSSEQTSPPKSPEPEPTKRGPYRKKRQEEGRQTYRELFLVNDGECSRVSTYVNRDIHEKIKRLLSNAAPGVSIVSYLNNILAHHLEEHQDEIEQLYRTGIEKPLLS